MRKNLVMSIVLILLVGTINKPGKETTKKQATDKNKKDNNKFDINKEIDKINDFFNNELFQSATENTYEKDLKENLINAIDSLIKDIVKEDDDDENDCPEDMKEAVRIYIPQPKLVTLQEGYNEACMDQLLKIILSEDACSSYYLKAYVPIGIEVLKENYQPSKNCQDGKHKWIFGVKEVGKYTIVVDYINKYTNMVAKRRRYTVEILRCLKPSYPVPPVFPEDQKPSYPMPPVFPEDQYAIPPIFPGNPIPPIFPGDPTPPIFPENPIPGYPVQPI
ncbi:hypothetical protein AN639_04105 [Candidatus Epulonipiscium fishelsonii]|uniref:Uncharacterized protein n=1 Tax=Candidatus Epulonipiscium fishelsonii TaxID=77094 RepID=A0ACC8XHK6_9FIRM|nr:hypothetical protein AN639_04105 [Epulopiscium sp. SCG-B05WGA-EpuloA1]ONI42843.1 hypothetical protein AN396_12985 [Epulopiscium sp. SCG-B11WGA-EpuloA1]